MCIFLKFYEKTQVVREKQRHSLYWKDKLRPVVTAQEYYFQSLNVQVKHLVFRNFLIFHRKFLYKSFLPFLEKITEEEKTKKKEKAKMRKKEQENGEGLKEKTEKYVEKQCEANERVSKEENGTAEYEKELVLEERKQQLNEFTTRIGRLLSVSAASENELENEFADNWNSMQYENSEGRGNEARKFRNRN